MKTRMNKCKFFNSFGSCLCMLILAGIFASCNFGNKPDFNKADIQKNVKKYVEIKGKLKLSVGALPSEVFGDANNSSSNINPRSALPSFSGTRSYYVKATPVDGTESDAIEAQIDEATQTYTITLDSEKTWNLEAGFKLDDTTIFTDTWEDVDPSTDKTHNFILTPSINPTKFGKISLELTIKNELKDTISRVSADCISSNKENWEVKLTPSDIVFEETEDVKVTISTSSIPSGLYEVSIEFYNESNVRVYSTIQAINVFDSLTTNTWLSNGGISPIKSDGTFELTSDLIKIYEKTHFYVGETAFCDAPDDTSATGSPVKPFASIAGAANYLSTYGNKAIDYTLYVNGTLEEAQTLDGDILAQSITITGYNGLDYITHEPQDSITVTDDSSALTISTEIPVTIRDLKITKGSSHGLHVASDAKVFLAGNPVIDDLYLESTSTYDEESYSPGSLLLAEDLGSFASITITPDTYTAPYYYDSEGGYIIKVQYVSIEEESTIDIAENSKYFSITPELDGDENPTDTEWIIDDNGCLNKYCILTFEGEGINSMTTQKVPCTYFEPGKLIEPTREGYLFKGYYYQKETEHWGGSQYSPEQQPSTYEMLSFDYKEADYEDEEGNTVTDSNYTFVNSDMTLYATWRCLTINNIYVDADNGADSVWCSQDGSTISLGDGSEGFPLRTLNSAFDLIKEINDATEDYTITISGFTNEHDLPINSELPVNSLTLQGSSSAETDGIKASNISVSVLPVSTTKSVTIRNMLINLSNVSYAVEGAVMNIGNGSTVTLEEGTIFEGPSSSVDSKGAVAIENGGTLIMQNDVTFQKFDIKCGAVNVKTGGTFTMNGGTFTNNESNGTCGAVYVNGGTFTMKDGYIKDNWQDAFQRANALPQGAGVCVASGTFIMEGGHITGNKSCVADGHDNMTTAGGGVFVYADGEFIMRGGEISDNHAYNQKISVAGKIYEEIDTTAHSYGGGVCLQASGNKIASFTMTGGTISGNTAGTSGNAIGFLGTPNEGVTGTITLGGDAVITSNNDIYLPDYMKIAIESELTEVDRDNAKVPTITPSSYTRPTSLFTDETLSDETLKSEISKFAITDKTSENSWSIDADGMIQALVSGSVSFDSDNNFALISIDKNNISVLGDNISITTKDINDSEITDVSYTAKILYGGNNTESTKVINNTVSISPLIVTGKYQLYITATYTANGTSHTASQTFGIDVVIPSFTLYVSKTGSENADGFTESTAVSSLQAASTLISTYSELTDDKLDWVINIAEGTYTGAAKFSFSGDSNIKSLTIEGAGSDKTIFDGGFTEDNPGNTLTLSAKAITLSNVKVTGGYTNKNGAGIYLGNGTLTANNVIISGNTGTGNGDYGAGTGAGIYINNNAVFIMNGGTITNNVGTYGGGVRNCGTMFMYGDAVIGNKNANSSAVYDETTPENNAFGNRAEIGGGIYSDGNLYLGYSGFDSDGTTPLPTDFSGGIYQNFADSKGGGIYLNTWKSVYMNSGTIAYNKGSQGSGVWTTIGNNTYNEICGLFMSGSALITSNNDVYLNSYNTYYAYIYVTGELKSTEEKVAYITPNPYNNGRKVVYISEDSGINLEDQAAVYEKFAVTQEDEETGTWSIDNSGNITYTEN